jgi:hypothetical protein
MLTLFQNQFYMQLFKFAGTDDYRDEFSALYIKQSLLEIEIWNKNCLFVV